MLEATHSEESEDYWQHFRIKEEGTAQVGSYSGASDSAGTGEKDKSRKATQVPFMKPHTGGRRAHSQVRSLVAFMCAVKHIMQVNHLTSHVH